MGVEDSFCAWSFFGKGVGAAVSHHLLGLGFVKGILVWQQQHPLHNIKVCPLDIYNLKNIAT